VNIANTIPRSGKNFLNAGDQEKVPSSSTVWQNTVDETETKSKRQREEMKLD